MSLADPLVMGLIPVALVAVWWTFRPTRAALSASFANIRRLWADGNGLSDSIRARRRWTHGFLLGLGALLALTALSEPQWGKIEATTYDQSREVLLALDLSRSMLANDVSPTRLDRAKLLIQSLLDQLKGERVGLVVFAGTSFLQSPMSADYEVLRDFLRDLDPSYLPQGGTEYGAMLTTAVKAFGQDGDGDRYLVVLSDGEAQDGEWRALLPSLQQKGIHVIGLGIGTAAGALVPDVDGGAMKDERGAAVLSRLEPATLQELAAATGGTYRDAATWVDIGEVVQATVDQGRIGRYVEKKETQLRHRYQWFLAPALAFFLLSFCFEFPVLPVPRRLRQRLKVTAPVRAAAMTALLVLALVSARAAEASTEPAATVPGDAPASAALEGVVEELADKPVLAASDYERLATTTIDVASKPDSLHGLSRLGVLDDALRGVTEGEQMDAKAADWPKLRQDLERLKEEEKKNEEQQSQQDKQEQQQQGQGGEEQKDEKSGGQQAQPQDDAKDQPKDGESQKSAGEDSKDPKNDAAQKDDAEKKDVQAQAQAGSDDAEPPKPGTRLVGGGPLQGQPADGESLALVEALDRMQRIKEGDSPSTLFDRMNRADGVRPQKQNERNW